MIPETLWLSLRLTSVGQKWFLNYFNAWASWDVQDSQSVFGLININIINIINYPKNTLTVFNVSALQLYDFQIIFF